MRGIPVIASLAGRLTSAVVMFAVLFFCLVPDEARADIGAFILVDAKSGAVIDQKNATRKWYPASLTKMMTAYVTFKAIREGRATLNSAVVQSKNSISEPPSKMGFKVGTRFTVDTALKIILIKSANDVAVALGEAISGSEAAFIAAMNAEARRLGMTNTRFTNPHGLPDNGQVTTARDMAILAMALRRDFPESRDFYKYPGIRFGKKTLRSANREFLLRVPGANGMKTGYICNSGYNVAASVSRKGRTLIAIILGAGSGLERTAFARQLFDNGFRKRGGQNVSTLTGSSGNPPANGYCRRNKSPGPNGYMARFDMQNEKRGGFLFFKADKTKEKNADASGYTKSNGKPDWAKILDRTLGPRRLAYKPLQVSLGNPSGRPAAGASTSALEVLAPAENIPLPVANPMRRAEMQIRAKLQQTAEASAVGAIPQTEQVAGGDSSPAAPGSIFRKGLDFSVPVPTPSPRRQ
ncbi:D-alanyl-D-alanine carboxypeptidase [Roseibium porphyridii]|uniref:D-alanyl-D-alanine carboxypeptidase n=1 Tax=Roseibium porphyridii TaxID=2866279 RepID=A0ABY8F415_9HYPH|nr:MULTISPECIES: D-alanyl-D-alanine carboxypeptidase family protein [Stappiaceae]QFT29245.1 D-alanyl-D-alanine carboxypeptidase DacC precursor [Labrenzia sp. THAF82]WFE90233.1 D-alanyl-D-alanine carboxypeptidase [Roseibium sp. KMA01]